MALDTTTGTGSCRKNPKKGKVSKPRGNKRNPTGPTESTDLNRTNLKQHTTTDVESKEKPFQKGRENATH